jgi:hypothetical protein
VKGAVALVGGLAEPYEERVRWNLSELKEIKSLVFENDVWDVLYPPPGANIMTLKWVYTVKTNGELKSRLVARGFKQIQGVDYHETFSPVAKLVTLRIVLSLAASYDLELGCMDIKTAFLNAPIDEDVWVHISVIYLSSCLMILRLLQPTKPRSETTLKDSHVVRCSSF